MNLNVSEFAVGWAIFLFACAGFVYFVNSLPPLGKVIAALVIALLLLAGKSRAQERPFVYDLSEYSVVTGHALDLGTTQRCLGSGRCREANPFLLRFDQPVAFAAAKFGIGGLQLWATRRIARSHPRWAAVTNYSIAAAFTSLAIRNQRIGR